MPGRGSGQLSKPTCCSDRNRREFSGMPFDVEALAAETLVDPEGNPHRLGEVWANQTHLVLFLRHFG